VCGTALRQLGRPEPRDDSTTNWESRLDRFVRQRRRGRLPERCDDERDSLWGPCAQEDADRAEAERVARRRAEEVTAREEAEAEAKKNRGLFGRRR
ncbi:hypothetical protein J7E96_36905, partial [Streptomyces sp. ISL-96]|nr:hypothetical protein [Streptomyces sp. ISL-96]